MDKIAVLGPENSYCHILAKKAFPEGDFIFCTYIEEIFRKVEGMEAEKGVAPIENMLHGSVREAITSLNKYNVKINRAFNLPIHHCIASQSNDFKTIISHPQAIAQCSGFLEDYKNKGLKIENCTSTSKAISIAKENKDYAAIGSKIAAIKSNLSVLKENIEDNNNNVTRFIQISKIEQGEGKRTSMMINPKEDKPGLLHDILSVFKERGVNLTKLESLPSGKKLGEYNFFIEAEGDLKEAINLLKKSYGVKVFGSYDIIDF
jgi:prephenate dehydratase